MESTTYAEQWAVAVFDISARRKPSRVGTASPKDFELTYSGTLPADIVRKHGILYCADFKKEQVLFTLLNDAAAVLRHAFLYAGQFAQADRIACAPFHQLDRFFPEVNPRPNFLFSAGRCGSTLLAALLRACGLPTASEPDLPTQLAKLRLFHTDHLLADLLHRACIASLAEHLGAELAVKYRSQCNSIASHIARAFPSAKFVFILREPISWARSRYRAFPADPKALARIYLAAVISYDRLCVGNWDPILLWYEDIIGQPLRTLERLALEGLPLRQITPELVANVLASDSQAGTYLESRRLGESEMTTEQIRGFEQEWRRIRPDAIIKQRKLERILT